jgi:hypothetical protein
VQLESRNGAEDDDHWTTRAIHEDFTGAQPSRHCRRSAINLIAPRDRIADTAIDWIALTGAEGAFSRFRVGAAVATPTAHDPPNLA